MVAPSKEDITKIHSEVNIYVSQRVTLLIGAISLVAVMLAWVTQKINPSDISSLGMLYAGSSILLVFLCVICVLDVSLQMSIASLVTYLRLKDASTYEKDHQKFLSHATESRRTKLWFGRITSRDLTFVALGGVAAAWPAVVAVIVFNAKYPSPFSLFHVATTCIFALVVFVFAPRFVNRRHEQIETLWKKVLLNEDSSFPDTDVVLPLK